MYKQKQDAVFKTLYCNPFIVFVFNLLYAYSHAIPLTNNQFPAQSHVLLDLAHDDEVYALDGLLRFQVLAKSSRLWSHLKSLYLYKHSPYSHVKRHNYETGRLITLLQVFWDSSISYFTSQSCVLLRQLIRQTVVPELTAPAASGWTK